MCIRDSLVGHVQVPAVHHRLFGVQIQQVVPDVVLPGHAVVQPGQLILGVWSVAAHQVEVRVLRRDDPPLVAVLIDTEVIRCV